MHLDDRRLEQLERVADRVAVVRPRAGIDDHAVGPVERLVDPVDVLALVVRLLALRARVDVARPLVDLRLELAERPAAVQLGVAPPEHVHVHAVEDEDAHGAESTRRSARRGPHGRPAPGSSASKPPSSPRRITRSRPFLSRWSASHARSRSTRAGSGWRTSSTASVGRPERRSAASRPSATARPCGSSYPAAASSACANVCPRLRTCRGPSSCGSRRQSGRLERGAAADELGVGQLPERLAREQPRLHDLGHAVQALGRRQRLEQGRIDHRPDRPVERADEVLALGQVDSGLAADRRVDLPDQRAGHV